MDTKGALRGECTVSGALGLVLRLSRALGVAPVRMERARGVVGAGGGTWRVSLSRSYYAYNCLVLIVLVTFYAIFVVDEREGVEDGYERASQTAFMRVVMAVLLALFAATGVTFVATAAARTRHLVDCTAHLQQINAEIDRVFQVSPATTTATTATSEKRTYAVVVVSILYGYFTVCFYYGLYLRDVIRANYAVPLVSCSFVAVFLCLLQLQQYSLQFSLVVLRLVATQRRLNSSLKVLLQEIHNDMRSLKKMKIDTYKPIPNHSMTYVIDILPVIVRGGLSTDPETLDQLIHMYCSLCGVVRQLGASNAPALLTLLCYVLAYLVTAPYFVVAIIRTHTEVPVLKSLSVLVWCGLCFSLAATIAEPCHRSHIEMSRCTRREALALRHELNMFRRHIALNPVSFAPLGLVTLDRTLLVTMLSTSVTYLSVVIHL